MPKPKQMTLRQMEAHANNLVANWNQKYPPGTAVDYEDLLDSGDSVRTTTTSKAMVMSCEAVVFLEDWSGAVSIEHCTPVGPAPGLDAPASILGASDIEKCLAPLPKPVITPVEAYSWLISVVVGGGVYREKTVAALFRIAGAGTRMDPSPLRAEQVSIIVESQSDDLQSMARSVFNASERNGDCLILVDTTGLGEQFIQQLRELGAKQVMGSQWGRKPVNLLNHKRFINQRAQCNIHAAEAVKDFRVSLLPDWEQGLRYQAPRLPYSFDENGRYAMKPREEMAAVDKCALDLWDTVAMVFLESLPTDRACI